MGDAFEYAYMPHLLMVPFPTQGHVNPMLKLGKLLHHRGFRITFLNTDSNHQCLLRSGGDSILDGLIPNFHFASIPDGLPPSPTHHTAYDIIVSVWLRSTLSDHFREFVSGLITSSNDQPLTCIIVDSFMRFSFDVAKMFRIPTVQLVIFGAGPILPWYLTKDLVDNGLIPLKDESCLTNGYLDTIVKCIPGLEGIPLKSIQRKITVTNLNDLNNIKAVCEDSIRADSSAILLNTFDDLESPSIQKISELYSPIPVLGIGPIHLLENHCIKNGPISFNGSLWKEDATCIDWLDSKRAGSVLYVSFGSIASLTSEQLEELAWGLANSKHDFLWVIRPDLVRGDGKMPLLLPKEFEMEIKDRAFLTSWCPQEKVLQHRAIGGFLTQCGWNSFLESMCAGLPILCLPKFAEQATNTWLCCKKWGMGLEIDNNNINRHEVEKLIKELMCSKKGQDLKEKAMEWKKKAEKACTNGSYANFEKLVKLLRSLQKPTND